MLSFRDSLEQSQYVVLPGQLGIMYFRESDATYWRAVVSGSGIDKWQQVGANAAASQRIVLADAATLVPDLSVAQQPWCVATLNADRAMGKAVGYTNGQIFTLELIQGAGGPWDISSWDASYLFDGGPQTVTATQGHSTIITFLVDGSGPGVFKERDRRVDVG